MHQYTTDYEVARASVPQKITAVLKGGVRIFKGGHQ